MADQYQTPRRDSPGLAPRNDHRQETSLMPSGPSSSLPGKRVLEVNHVGATWRARGRGGTVTTESSGAPAEGRSGLIKS